MRKSHISLKFNYSIYHFLSTPAMNFCISFNFSISYSNSEETSDWSVSKKTDKCGLSDATYRRTLELRVIQLLYITNTVHFNGKVSRALYTLFLSINYSNPSGPLIAMPMYFRISDEIFESTGRIFDNGPHTVCSPYTFLIWLSL